MARPKSPEKRQAILDAATHQIAQSGLSASTAAIARAAGIAEGTLFTYFPSKDELFNELYIELKTASYGCINQGFPHHARLRDRIRHIWTQNLKSALEAPDERKASLQLHLSEIITPETRNRLVGDRAAVDQAFSELSQRGAFRDLPPSFSASAISAMLQAVLDTLARNPEDKDAVIEFAFNAFWQMTK